MSDLLARPRLVKIELDLPLACTRNSENSADTGVFFLYQRPRRQLVPPSASFFLSRASLVIFFLLEIRTLVRGWVSSNPSLLSIKKWTSLFIEGPPVLHSAKPEDDLGCWDDQRHSLFSLARLGVLDFVHLLPRRLSPKAQAQASPQSRTR